MKRILLSLSLVISVILGGLAVSLPTYADDVCNGNFSDALKEAAGCNTTATADSVLNGVLDVIFGIVGVIGVCVIIYGGFMFLTSAGEAQKAYKARHAIIYGVVGLIVAMLAFTIVQFVSRAANGV